MKTAIVILIRPASWWHPCPIPKLGTTANGRPFPWTCWGQATTFYCPSDQPHCSRKNTQCTHTQTITLQTHALTYIHWSSHGHSYLHTCTHTLAPTLIQAHTHAPTSTRTHAFTHCTLTFSHVCTHTPTYWHRLLLPFMLTHKEVTFTTAAFQVLHLWRSFVYTGSLLTSRLPQLPDSFMKVQR